MYNIQSDKIELKLLQRFHPPYKNSLKLDFDDL